MNDPSGEETNGDQDKESWFEHFKKNVKDEFRKPKVYVEILALVGLFWYTCETHCTNGLTHDALTNSKTQFTESQKESKRQFDAAQKSSTEQFHEAERPYVWITATGIGGPEFYPNPLDPKGFGQVIWSYHYTDYGKTPAYDVRTTAKLIRIGVKGGFKPSYGFQAPPTDIQGAPIPPGSDNFATVVSSLPTISPETFKHLIETDYAIAIKITIEYTDAYGGKYETGMCFTRLRLNASMFCREGNYIK